MIFEEKYRKEIDEIKITESFRRDTVIAMQRAAEGKESLLMKRKPIKVLIAAVVLILILTLSAFAIGYLLSADEVAEKVGDKEVAELFKEKDFKPETINNEEYTVTLHGVVFGKELNEADGVDISEGRSYAVISVARTDGTALNQIEGSPLQMVPVIEGYSPSTVWSLGISAFGLEHEGVLYYLFDYGDLEIFADRAVSIVVFEGHFPTADILTMDEDGKTVYSETYRGFKGIFALEMDETKADPEAAEELLANF